MKILCEWDEKHYDFFKNSRVDWVRIAENKVTTHLVSKCPICDTEKGFTWRLDFPEIIVEEEES